MKSKFKFILLCFLVVSSFLSFAVVSSAAPSTIAPGEYVLDLQPKVLDYCLLKFDFVCAGRECDGIEFSVDDYDDPNSGLVRSLVSIQYQWVDDGWDSVFVEGAWLSDEYRVIEITDTSGITDPVMISYLRSVMTPMDQSPYGGLYGNVYSLIRKNIYGNAYLEGGSEITCSIVSTLLCIVVLVLPMLLVWCIIKAFSVRMDRLY